MTTELGCGFSAWLRRLYMSHARRVDRLGTAMVILVVALHSLPTLAAPSGATTEVQTPRLAIIPTKPAFHTAVDLLTVAFSSNPEIALVERSQIDRVYTELALGITSAQTDFLKLGQLLGADGLLVLEEVPAGRTNMLQMTLVATGPGVVLKSERYPAGVATSPEWSDQVGRQCASLIPKLSVSSGSAVPISVVNLHSPVSTPGAIELERELTLLLVHRLTQEPSLFVLERRRMDALEREKEYSGKERSAFWNGAYVLEGTVNSAGARAGKTTLGLSVAPRGGAGSTIEVEGFDNDLPGLVNDLVGKILVATKKEHQGAVWNPAAEADRYRSEAEWGLRWGMLTEAQSAAEAAWVLGLRTPLSAALRVSTYSQQVTSDRGTTTSRLVFASRDAYSGKPDPSVLRPAQRALELYLMHTKEPVSPAMLDKVWSELGADLVFRVAQVLDHFYHTPDAQSGVQKELSATRNLTREVFSTMRANPVLRQPVEGLLLGPEASTEQPFVGIGFGLERRFANLWVYTEDTPREVAIKLREMVASGEYGRRNSPFRRYGWSVPELVAWEPDHMEEAKRLWKEMLDDLSGSERSQGCLEAELWRLTSSRGETGLEQALPKFFDAVWKHREVIFSDPVAESIWAWYQDQIQAGYLNRQASYDSAVHVRIREELIRPFSQRMGDARKAYDARLQDQARAQAETTRLQVVNDLRRELAEGPTVSSYVFSGRFGHVKPTEDEARELLPLALAYGTKARKDASEVRGIIRRIRMLAKDPTLASNDVTTAKAANNEQTSQAVEKRSHLVAFAGGPLPLFQSPAIFGRLMGVMAVVGCASAIAPLAFKRTRFNVCICGAGIVLWAVMGWLIRG